MRFRRVLLASHGTPGARAAETQAIALCAAGGIIDHLIVVPAFWKGMLGDDWLNNAATQIRFGKYVEGQLEREAAGEVERLAAAVRARGLDHAHETTLGDPTESLLASASRQKPDLIVIGAPRPKGVPGYRSRIDVDKLLRRLTVPLMVVPYPRP